MNIDDIMNKIEIKLGDFGLSKAIETSGLPTKNTGGVGTL